MVINLPPPAIRFTVFGIPAPKGSKSAFPVRGKDGRMHVAVSEGKQGSGIRVWRSRVEEVVQELARSGMPLLDEPLEMVVDFYLPKPASAPKRRRTLPDRKPDIDKLLRALLDPMTGVLIRDDARVVSIQARKHYADDADDDQRPRAEVSVWRAIDLTYVPVDDGETIQMVPMRELEPSS